MTVKVMESGTVRLVLLVHLSLRSTYVNVPKALQAARVSNRRIYRRTLSVNHEPYTCGNYLCDYFSRR